MGNQTHQVGPAGIPDPHVGRQPKPVEAVADPGEARVRVHAIGLNFADLFACLGLYSATPQASFVPGLEFAGVVEEFGPETDSSTLQPGERVFGLTRFGAYATALNSDLRYLRPSPPGWDFVEAAAFPVQGLTAWYGLIELGALKRGASVLLHSAAGGVGLNALQILTAQDVRVVATVGRRSKRDFLIERFGLSPDQIIVRDRRDFGRQLDGALAALGLERVACALHFRLGLTWRSTGPARIAAQPGYLCVRPSAVLTTSKRDDVRGNSTLDFPWRSQAFSHAASAGRSDPRDPPMVLVVDRSSGCIGPIEIGLVALRPGTRTTDGGHESG